jgi:hypothetical protein
MGRPLNKKYFGNRNIGANGNEGGAGGGQNFADDKIGGEGVGSVTINTVGAYTAGLPTVSFSTPTLPGGVQTTGTVHGNALSAATTSNGTGYRVGDVLTVAGGTKTSAATFPVASITTLGTPGITNGGALYDSGTGANGDRVTFTHANLSTPLRVRVTADTGGSATSIVVEQHGVWTGTGAFPTSIAGGVGGFTATTSGGPIDNNGNGLVLSLTGSNWGVYSFGTVAVQGDYTAMPANPASFTGGTGTDAAATVTFGVSGVVIDQKGSGYTNVADAAPTFSGGAAAGTAVLTTDSGVTNGMNAAGNQENAIIAYGYVDGGREVVDIIRQTNGRSYKIEGADGIVRSAKLVTDGDANADGEMDITATDFGGGTYRVAKLSGRKATLVRKGSGAWEFATGACVPWTFAAAPAATALQSGYNVKIDNA